MYTILGATGNTGSVVADYLLRSGKEVKVVSRSADNVKDLVAKGAQPAIGDVEDESFLKEAFTGSDAVYALVPPKADAENARAYQKQVGKNIADAVKATDVKHLVFLSSLGAHLPEGAGVVTGLHEVENILKNVKGLNILSLRASFFLENHLMAIGLIKEQGIFGGFPIDGKLKVPMVYTKDIAETATDALLKKDFEGFTIKEVAGAADYSHEEVAAEIGKAIGKTDLSYVQFPYDGAREAMIGMGISSSLADNYIEFCQAVNDGRLMNEYKRSSENTTRTTLDWFIQNVFVPAYKG